jgi:hypothetical protein
MIRIKCAKCYEILELTDGFQTCSCHMVVIRPKTAENANDWKSRIGGRTQDIIILDGEAELCGK